MPDDMRDIFLCHANEDKVAIVRPLAEALKHAQISYWLDEAELIVGANIMDEIAKGLAQSRYIVVILSTSFLQKKFPKRELAQALFMEASTGEVKVLPILTCTKEELAKEYTWLLNTSHLEWRDNAYEIVKALLPRLRPNSATVGKVCFVASEYPPYVSGGLGVHVTHLTAALGQYLQVDVILPSPEREMYHPPAPQVHLYPLAQVEASYDKPPSWLRFARYAAQRIISIADDFRPAVIHCHDWVTVLAGIKCRWYLDIPLVFHLHLPNRAPLCASVENLGLVCADLVTVNSEAMSAEVTDRHLTLRRPVEVVKNGVDLDMFHPGAEAAADEDYILFVGRLVEQKGVEYLLRAFYHVSRKFPDVHLKIVGDGPLRPELETLCANLVLSHQVEFVGWKRGRSSPACTRRLWSWPFRVSTSLSV